jgi:Extensin-like protein C-terminus
MSRSVQWSLFGSIVIAALIALAGCSSHYLTGERETWRRDAEVACLNSGAAKENQERVRISAITGPGMCGADFPLRVSALGESGPLGYDEEPLRPPGAIPDAALPQRWPVVQSNALPPASPVTPQYRQPQYGPPQYNPPQYSASQAVQPLPASQPAGPPLSLYAPGVQAPDEDDVDFQPGPPRPYNSTPAPRVSPPAMAAYPSPNYPAQSYPAQSYPPPSYPPQNYPPPSYPAQGYPPQNYPPPSYPAQSYPPPNYPPQAYPPQNYPAQTYPPPNSSPRAEPAPLGEEEHVPLGPPRTPTVTGTVGQVEVKPAATLACPIVSALDQWITAAVQPASARWFRQPVVEIKQISAYSCRGMNGDPAAHISEHAFGNALDIAAFVLADGHKISVQYGWRGTPEEQGFLHDVQLAACQEFTTVLAPGANVYHYNHIHVDLMRRTSGRHICQPAAIPGEVVAERARARYAAQHPGDPNVTGSIKNRQPRALGYSSDDDDGLPLAVPGED